MKRVVSLCIALIRIHTVDAMDWIIKSQTLETVRLATNIAVHLLTMLHSLALFRVALVSAPVS